MKQIGSVLLIVASFIYGCGGRTARQYREAEIGDITAISLSKEDEALLDTVQKQTFAYFWEGAEPNSGMACERIHMDGVYPQNDQTVVTLGGSGFGVMAILTGIERGFITRAQALQRLRKIVDFLTEADRFHGAWPHWLEGRTGKVKPFSPKDDGGDLVETAFMIQGLLTVAEYFADSLVGRYGPYDAYSVSHRWYTPRYLAIDQGPIAVMIENYRTGLLWNLFMRNKDVKKGLERLGMESGSSYKQG